MRYNFLFIYQHSTITYSNYNTFDDKTTKQQQNLANAEQNEQENSRRL